MGRYVKSAELAELEAANEVCWTLNMMIHVGHFETISLRSKKGKDTRKWLGEPLDRWCQVAMKEDSKDG